MRERVKCRTGGRSRGQVEGMRSVPPPSRGPGEDRHLMRVRSQYAPGSRAGVENTCPGCLAASGAFANPRYANSGDSIEKEDEMRGVVVVF